MHTEILSVDVFQEISGRRDGLRMEHIADAAKHIATVIERNRLQILCHRHPRFQIHYHHGVAADRNCKWINANQFSLAIAKLSLRDDDLTWARFFIAEPAESSRTSGKETLADWQQPIEIVDAAIAVAIARSKRLRQTDSQVAGKHRLSGRRQ